MIMQSSAAFQANRADDYAIICHPKSFLADDYTIICLLSGQPDRWLCNHLPPQVLFSRWLCNHLPPCRPTGQMLMQASTTPSPFWQMIMQSSASFQTNTVGIHRSKIGHYYEFCVYWPGVLLFVLPGCIHLDPYLPGQPLICIFMFSQPCTFYCTVWGQF